MRRPHPSLILLATLATLTSPAASLAAEPPTLESLLDRALADSPALAQARARLDAAAAREDGARAEYYPQLALTERYSTSTDPPTAFASVLQQGRLTPEVQEHLNDPDRTDDWMTSAGVRWVAFAAGRGARRDSAEAGRRQHEHLESVARRDVRHAVTEAWLALTTARAEVALWESTVALFDGHERTARARFEEGAALRSEPLSVAVRRDDARESLAAARRAVEVARARLAAAVGCEPAEAGDGAAGLEAPAYGRTEAGVVEAARTSHPLVLAADAAVEGAGAAERAAAAGRRPSVFVDLRSDWHGDDESPGFERSSWSAAVVADWVVADFGRTAALRREAAAGRLEAEAARRQLEDELALAARTAHAEAVEAQERIALADASSEAAAAALAIVEERWKSGLAPVVDLLDAQRSLSEARVRALEARARAWSAAAQVERLAGPASSADGEIR